MRWLLAQSSWPVELSGPYPTLLPYLEPIIGSGSALGRAPRPGQAALMMLDALEPIGVTTLVLDTCGLLPALGACALAQPLSTVQALGAGALVTLGTVVTPVGRARMGETILSLRMKYQNGGDLEVEVDAGSLEVLPLPPGQKATLELKPRRNVDVGSGPGRGGKRRGAEADWWGLSLTRGAGPWWPLCQPTRKSGASASNNGCGIWGRKT